MKADDILLSTAAGMHSTEEDVAASDRVLLTMASR